MKIKKTMVYRNKLLKLQLIKLKVYKKNRQRNTFETLINNSMEHVELFLKKIFHVIHFFHLNNKKIFFIGVPKLIEKNFSSLLKKSKHLFLPESLWTDGIISNKESIFQYLRLKQLKNIKKKNLKLLFSIKKQPDLVVILNQKTEQSAMKEMRKLRVPTVMLSSDLAFQERSFGDIKFLNKKTNNVLFLLINSIFKKLKK
jgi:hypothetical protein